MNAPASHPSHRLRQVRRLRRGLAGVLLSCAALAQPATQPLAPDPVCVNGECSSAGDLPARRAHSAHDFTESVGVNTHFGDRKTAYYTAYPVIRDKLIASGIRYLRDGAIDTAGRFSTSDQAARYRELGRAGLRVQFIFNLNVSREFVQGFPERVAPAFDAYEYPNEHNAADRTGWAAGLRAWAPVFHGYVKGSAATAGYPISGPSLIDLGDQPYATLGDLSRWLDYGNVHHYFTSRHPGTVGWGGRGVPPCDAWRYGAIDFSLCNARRVSANKPIQVTETGWGSDSTQRDQVTPALQAKYLARMLLRHFAAGIRRTYIYQFADAGGDSFAAYGLVTAQGAEKPAFRYVQGLLAALRDDVRVDPGELRYSLDGNRTDVGELLLRRSDGTFVLALWLEQAGFDPVASRPVTVPRRSLTLRLLPTYRVAWLRAFGDDGRSSLSMASGAGGTYTLELGDNVTLVEIAATGG